MEKGEKPREFWVDMRDADDEANYAGEALFKHPRQGPLLWQECLIHVREVVPLTDDEKRRVEVIKNHITSNRLLSGEGQKFLLSLLERAGVC